jgi:hypothetical protein
MTRFYGVRCINKFEGKAMSKFESKLDALRNLSLHLVPYNFPLGPVEMEYYISPLKKCEADVDGYSIVFHLNRASYGDHFLESFQVYNKYAPFLPFCLVAKTARKALGSHHLSLVEFYQDDKKIYCWSVCLDLRGRPTLSPMYDRCDSKVFEGFRYSYMLPEQLNLY